VSGPRPALALDRITLDLGPQAVFRDASLSVATGETVAIVGAVGTGKSSVVRLGCGAELPASGTVRALGIDPAVRIESVAGRLGVLFQTHGLLATMSVRENLALPLTYHDRVPRDQLNDTLLEAMDVARLDPDELDSRPAVMSGGELRRAALARAWLTGWELLLLDDLLRGREFDDVAAFRAFQARVQARCPAAIVLSTQDVTFAAEIADRIVAVVDHDLVELNRTLPLSELSAQALGITA
jgi:ABC-type transporter Mla maintaining outer membrane lipid asymmetry ATPase subunit MlaF